MHNNESCYKKAKVRNAHASKPGKITRQAVTSELNIQLRGTQPSEYTFIILANVALHTAGVLSLTEWKLLIHIQNSALHQKYWAKESSVLLMMTSHNTGSNPRVQTETDCTQLMHQN